MNWEATYNLVAPETGDTFDLIGRVTLQNMSGKDFNNATVKLMAGDVDRAANRNDRLPAKSALKQAAGESGAAWSLKRLSMTFDEYHLYKSDPPGDAG